MAEREARSMIPLNEFAGRYAFCDPSALVFLGLDLNLRGWAGRPECFYRMKMPFPDDFGIGNSGI